MLSTHHGKIQCLKELNLDGEVQVIGDGYSDYVTKEAGVAEVFRLYRKYRKRKNHQKRRPYCTQPR